jgi:hypothetical protein
LIARGCHRLRDLVEEFDGQAFDQLHIALVDPEFGAVGGDPALLAVGGVPDPRAALLLLQDIEHVGEDHRAGTRRSMVRLYSSAVRTQPASFFAPGQLVA